jgi:uncharacterized RDD family membrane protein YckC
MADVITGEAVALELPVATFPSRIAALLIDMIVQFALLLLLIVVFVGVSGSVPHGLRPCARRLPDDIRDPE